MNELIEVAQEYADRVVRFCLSCACLLPPEEVEKPKRKRKQDEVENPSEPVAVGGLLVDRDGDRV